MSHAGLDGDRSAFASKLEKQKNAPPVFSAGRFETSKRSFLKLQKASGIASRGSPWRITDLLPDVALKRSSIRPTGSGGLT
jgi:hypothetical protein